MYARHLIRSCLFESLGLVDVSEKTCTGFAHEEPFIQARSLRPTLLNLSNSRPSTSTQGLIPATAQQRIKTPDIKPDAPDLNLLFFSGVHGHFWGIRAAYAGLDRGSPRMDGNSPRATPAELANWLLALANVWDWRCKAPKLPYWNPLRLKLKALQVLELLG